MPRQSGLEKVANNVSNTSTKCSTGKSKTLQKYSPLWNFKLSLFILLGGIIKRTGERTNNTCSYFSVQSSVFCVLGDSSDLKCPFLDCPLNSRSKNKNEKKNTRVSFHSNKNGEMKWRTQKRNSWHVSWPLRSAWCLSVFCCRCFGLVVFGHGFFIMKSQHC